jgi:hypothetical protein
MRKRIKNSQFLRAKIFGKKFVLTRQSRATRIDAENCEIVVADSAAQLFSGGLYSLKYDGGSRIPRAEILYGDIKGKTIWPDAKIVSVSAGPSLLTVKVKGTPSTIIDLTANPISTVMEFQAYQFSVAQDIVEFEGFKILSLSVTKPNNAKAGEVIL